MPASLKREFVGPCTTFLTLTVSRMIFTTAWEAPRGWLWISVGSGAAWTAVLAAHLLGWHHVAAVALIGLTGVVALAAVLFRYLMPSLAVSVLGVVLGVASLVCVAAVTTGFESELTRRLARVHAHVLITKYGLDFEEYDAVADRWIADPEVRAASPFTFGSAVLLAETFDGAPRTTVVLVKGLDPLRAAGIEGFTQILRLGDPAALRPANPTAAPGIALGYRLARRHGVHVGEFVRLVAPGALSGPADGSGAPKMAEFLVTDLVDTGVLELDERLALVHLTAGQALLFGRRRVTGVELELVAPESAPGVAARIEAKLNEGRRLRLYRTSHWQQQNSSALAVIRQVRAYVSLILGLMVLVAASSLVVAMLFLLRRKRHDTAVLRCLGATSWMIFAVYECIGLFVGSVGVALGCGLGTLLAAVLGATRVPVFAEAYGLGELPVRLVAGDLVLPALLTVLLCLLVTAPAARSACRVPPLRIFVGGVS
ncbi:MAG: FtsX-like permease family protein [Nannocystaceae bacterium]